MLNIIKKVGDFLTTVLFTIAAILAFLLVGVRLFGLDVYTVLSGSMEPQYHTGSVIYVRDVDYTDLQAGDVITYSINSNTIATHRIIEVVADGENAGRTAFRTKGDANEIADGNLVRPADIIGTPVFTIPYLGFVAAYIQSPPGVYVVLTVAGAVILLSLIPNLFEKEEKE